jgi:hypothetical protein
MHHLLKLLQDLCRVGSWTVPEERGPNTVPVSSSYRMHTIGSKAMQSRIKWVPEVLGIQTRLAKVRLKLPREKVVRVACIMHQS